MFFLFLVIIPLVTFNVTVRCELAEIFFCLHGMPRSLRLLLSTNRDYQFVLRKNMYLLKMTLQLPGNIKKNRKGCLKKRRYPQAGPRWCKIKTSSNEFVKVEQCNCVKEQVKGIKSELNLGLQWISILLHTLPFWGGTISVRTESKILRFFELFFLSLLLSPVITLAT